MYAAIISQRNGGCKPTLRANPANPSQADFATAVCEPPLSAVTVVFRTRRSPQAVDSARGRKSDLRPKNRCTAHICGFPRPRKQLNIDPNCGYDSFIFSGQVFLCLPKRLTTATGLSAEPQWRCGISFFCWLPTLSFTRSSLRFVQNAARRHDRRRSFTADFSQPGCHHRCRVSGRKRIYSTGAAPPRQALVRAVDRSRLWRDLDRGWLSVDFDTGKKGVIVIAAHWVASCILWLLF
jgi:hypothetical protein